MAPDLATTNNGLDGNGSSTSIAPSFHNTQIMPVVSPEQMLTRHRQLIEFKDQVLKVGFDYGTIPGTNEKMVLLKPGAEKLCTYFGLTARFYVIEKIEDWTGSLHAGEPFFYYWYRCELTYNNHVVAQGEGSCNSWESKYRYRRAERVCPDCNQETIFKSKTSEGWFCWNKKGGCGLTFRPDDERITKQEVGRKPNPEICDQVNTILKMAIKRALLAATLMAINATDFFTTEEEYDTPDDDPEGAPRGGYTPRNGPSRPSATGNGQNGNARQNRPRPQNTARNETQDDYPADGPPGIRTSRMRELADEAVNQGWAVENGKINQFRLLNAIRAGGFPHAAITDENIGEAREAMHQHYGKGQSTPSAPVSVGAVARESVPEAEVVSEPDDSGPDSAVLDTQPDPAVLGSKEYLDFIGLAGARGFPLDTTSDWQEFAKAFSEWANRAVVVSQMTAGDFASASSAIEEGMVWDSDPFAEE